MSKIKIGDVIMSKSIENSRSENSGIRKRRGSGKIILIILLIILAIPLYLGLDVYFRTSSLLNEINREVDTIDLRQQQNLPELVLGETPFSLLILGIDSDFPGDPGRSDAIMIATVNPNEGTAYLVSIARDTRTYIEGRGFEDKINHAYAFGGAAMSIDTVQTFLDVPIDFYVTLSMDGFGPLVDAIGGVRVYNDTVEFTQSGYSFPLGYVDLHGDSALAFSRMRMQDPQGDFGRQQRQRSIIGAMLSEMAGVNVVTRYQNILGAAEDYMQTDVSLNEMIRISTGYTTALRNVTDLQMRGQGQMINGIYYEIIPEYQRLEMSQRLRSHLEISE